MSRKPSHKRPAKGTSVPATSCGVSRNTLRSNAARPVAAIVGEVVRDVWKGTDKKHDVELAYRMQSQLRAAQYVLAGTHDPCGEHLLNLINSDIGVTIVQAMTAHSDAPCWRRFRRQVQITEVRRTHALNETRLRDLERAAAE